MNISEVSKNPFGFGIIFAFGLMLFGVGAGVFGFFVAPQIYDHMRTRDWRPVRAEILSVKLIKSGDRSHVEARYAYEIDGRRHESRRVGIHTGSDNVGGYHQKLYRRLARAKARDKPVTVWVNPDDPGDAFIERNIRWFLVGLLMTFVLLFGGIGAYVLGAMGLWFFGRQAAAKGTDDAPWRTNLDWVGPVISFKSKQKVAAAWLITGGLFLFSWYLPFLILEEFQQGNKLALLGLVFPLLTIGFAVSAIRKTIERWRFGTLHVDMNPFPGSLGGDVAGTIDLAVPFNSEHRFKTILTCSRLHSSGQGNRRTDRQNAVWQEDAKATATPSALGTRLAFKFSPPKDLPESEEPSDSYHKWTLRLLGDLPGTDLERMTELPVYDTGMVRSTLSVEARELIDDPPVPQLDVVRIETTAEGLDLTYPAPRSLWKGLRLIVLGLITIGGPMLFLLAGSGGGASFSMGGMSFFTSAMKGLEMVISLLFLVICVPLGLLLVGFGSVLIGGSLCVRITASGLDTVQHLFGIPLYRRHADPGAVRSIEIEQDYQSSVGSKVTVTRKISAKLAGGKSITVGNGIRKWPLAEHLRELITEACGLSQVGGSSS